MEERLAKRVELIEGMLRQLPFVSPQRGSTEPSLGAAAPGSDYLVNGLMAFADGSSWDPGMGKGFYFYDSTNAEWLRDAPFVNVKFYGAKGDGVTDDSTAIQNAINASSAGDIIYFPGGNVFLVNSHIVYKPNRAYMGSVHTGTNGSVIKQKDNANISDGIFVAEAYVNQTDHDERVIFQDLFIDGNKDNNTGSAAGILAVNTISFFHHVTTFKTTGDGISLDSTYDTDQQNEHFIAFCRIYYAGGVGIHGGAGISDTRITSCMIGGSEDDGIYLEQGSGSNIEGNYLWGIEKNGIRVGSSTAIIITGNKIDGWGYSSTTGSYAAYLIGLNDYNPGTGEEPTPALVNSNQAQMKSPFVVGGSTYYGFYVAGSTGQTNAEIQITGNALHIDGSATSTFAYFTGNGYGTAWLFNNTATGFDTNITKANTNWTVIHKDNSFDIAFQTLAGSGTPSVLQGTKFFVGSGNITYSDFTNGFPGQEIFIVFSLTPGGASLVDFTGTSLKGNGGADYTYSQYDAMKCVFDGTNWYCTIIDSS